MAAQAIKVTEKQNYFGDDVKGHVAGCKCDKCTYVQVTPKAEPISDGKAMALQQGGFALKSYVSRLGGKMGKSGAHRSWRTRWPISFSVNCNSGGVITSTLTLSPDSNTTEWNGIVTLYDEFRVHGATVKFTPHYQTPATGGPDVALFAVGFDPIDANAATSVRNVCELEQHTLVAAQASSQATNSSTLVRSFGAGGGKPYVLRYKNAGLQALQVNTSNVVYASGVWKKTNSAGSNGYDGSLKFYGTSDFTSIAAVCSGIIYFDVEFRSRT